MDGLGLGAEWDEKGSGDWLDGEESRGSDIEMYQEVDSGSLGPQVDAPVDDVRLMEGIDVSDDPADEEEKEIVLGGGMFRIYIYISDLVRRF